MTNATYTPIETYTLGSPATSVTFGAGNTLPQTYTDLVIIIQGIQDSSYSARNMGIRFNSDSGSNYSSVQVLNASAGADANLDSLYGPLINGSGNTTSGVFADGIINVQNYSNNTTYKSIICYGGTAAQYTSGGSNVGTYVGFNASTWRNTNPVTQITLYATNTSGAGSGANWVAGSTFTLYGIQAAGGDVTPKATGGIVTSDSTYYYHTFLGSNTFTPLQSLTVDYLVVAGGGGGGYSFAGGGGAGGLRSTVTATGGGGSLESALSLTANTPYTVTVGAGGAPAVANNVKGSNGGNSIFASITSLGGGGGGSDGTPADPGAVGGSAGGSALDGGSTAGTANQGYAGGAGSRSNNTGGGGGGAGANGGAGGNTAGVSSYGGNGVQITALATPTSTGYDSGYYAGGGGGGGQSFVPLGGLGGGGNGNRESVVAPTAGKVNSGGGGGALKTDLGTSQPGGSGIVIVRYAKA